MPPAPTTVAPPPPVDAVVEVAPPSQPASESHEVRTAMRLPVIEAAEVAVNLPELASRIDGYNQSLRRIEAAVIAANQPGIRELTKLLDELAQLADQRDFIDLYVVGLSPAERASTPSLDTDDAVLSLIEEQLGDHIDSTTAASNSAERNALRALAQKLAGLQHKVPDMP
jgi:hypothetical protein